MNLYRFYLDFGRCGRISGTFAATEEDISSAMGKHLYFGEVLGKHSQVECHLDEEHIREVKCPTGFADNFAEVFPRGVGYNPLDKDWEY